MGKAGRIACIFVPAALTIAALVCVILVGLGGTNSSSSFLSSGEMYLIDTSNVDLSKFDDIPTDAAFNNLDDFYAVYLWNSCSGTKTADGNYQVAQCTGRKAQYVFDPLTEWGLLGDQGTAVLPDDIKNGIAAFNTLTRWTFISWMIAFVLTIVTLIIGFFAVLSRWGSCVTTIFAQLASTFYVLAAIGSTALAATRVGLINRVLEDGGITAKIGPQFLRIAWIGTAFSVGAAFFWLISICCCSGRNKRNAPPAFQKSVHDYERVESPYIPPTQQAYSQTPSYADPKLRTSAYEPFRHA